MNEQRQKTFVWLTLRGAVCIGLLLMVLVMLFSGHLEANSNAEIASNTMDTLKQQCISFNKLTAADRTKSLFRLSALLQSLSRLPKDERLHLFFLDAVPYLGCRSGCENYSLYIYYPAFKAFSVSLLTAAVFAAAYSILCLAVFAVRNRSLFENQAALRKSNHDLRRTIKMLQSLETIYFSLYYVDLQADRYDSIYIAPWLRSAVPDKGVYTELKQMFVDNMILPAYQADVDQRMSPEFIRETLCQKNITEVHKSFYTDYQSIRGGQNPWCRVTVTVVDYDNNGDPFHVLALLQDIDKEKAREAAYQARILKEAQDAKVANNAKTDFLRRISHDIRTPINGVQGYINMAAMHPDDVELQKHCQEQASIALHTLLELVNSVLDMSKLESSEIVLEQKPFDLNSLLDDVNTVLLPQAAARSVHFEDLRRGPLPIPRLIGSPRYLSQILMNITANAVKYSRPGGEVRVDARLLSHVGNTVTYEFVCADNGIGMSQEFQQHMFEPFMQEAKSARSTYEGVGLGLSIVKKLVDAMGGTINCQSEKDVGTTFRIQLTFQIDLQPELDRSARAADSALLEGRQVLLAEDNELNMEIAAELLTERGAVITKAWNGREAVERFSASAPGHFDLILMDIMMPEMNGLDATRAIRALDRPDAKTIPILAMSANSFQDDVQHSLDAGMNGHISKPIDPARLCAVLAGYIQ